MPKSRVTIIAEGQVMEIEGTIPSVQVNADCTMVVMPKGDGRVVSSSIRALQERFDIQSMQAPAHSWVMIQKVS